MEPEGDVHSFLFADLVGFTAFTEALGDEAAADVAVEFANDVRMLAADHGAEFIKAIGDAVMVRGRCAAQLVQLALRIAHDQAMRPGRPPARIGIHTGPAVCRHGDWYGNTVNVAAHLTDCARGGEVLLTVGTRRRIARDVACDLVDQGRRRLHNVAAPVRVFEARQASSRAAQPPMVAHAA